MSGITITVTTVLSLLGLGIAFYYMRKVTSVPVDMGLDEKDGERLRFIHGAIADGAMAFLKQEYKFLAIFMVVFAAIIAILIDDSHTPDYREGIYTAIAFLFGAAISIASGYIGMMVATQGNARTTVAAKKNISEAFDMAINAGAVMGFALVGLAALGLVIIYVVMSSLLSGLGPENNHILMEVIAGFGLGGSTI
ncbi:MAG: sodium/proton-translocating pyrophosphatase, partial [Pseudohongiellaceae bacterium]